MKRKVMLSLFVIFLAAAIIGGATMAWFTAKADAPENVFTAGTVMIEAGEEVILPDDDLTNVNPGDVFCKCIEIENTGTKNAYLRLTGLEANISIDWEHIEDNWEALCFTELEDKYPQESYGDIYNEDDEIEFGLFQTWVNEALDEGPPMTALPPQDSGGHAYSQEALILPILCAPCPEEVNGDHISDWAMILRPSLTDDPYDYWMEFLYVGGSTPGVFAPGDKTKFCYAVKFDGPYMDNLWQGATFVKGGGVFEAVQTTNDAPKAVWGEDDWGFYEGVFDFVDNNNPNGYELLKEYVRDWYADYFYDGDEKFKYIDYCTID